jgi:hypothetical protein
VEHSANGFSVYFKPFEIKSFRIQLAADGGKA